MDATGRKYPFRKVTVTGDGELLFGHQANVMSGADDGWWSDVLNDPRARTPMEVRISADSPMAGLRIDNLRAETLSFSCVCGNDRTENRVALVAKFGGDMNVHWLARLLFQCDRKNKMSNACRACFVR